jgi:GT2 family glycosyltransferase
VDSPLEVSVIIATRNRAEVLRATLDALSHQSLEQSRYEIIVVENGCSDDTARVLADLALTMPIVPLCLERAGKSAALNKGKERARGGLLVFTDDDVVPSQVWLAELVRVAGEHKTAAGFCGPIIPIYPDAAPPWTRQHAFRGPGFAEFAPPLAEGPLPSPRVPHGPNFAVTASHARGLLFRTDLGYSEANGPISCEDTEFARRVRETAGPIWFIPSASVGHRIRDEQLTIAWLVERAFNLGRSLIAERIPTPYCYPPVWRAGPPSCWTPLDGSLVINYLLGQMFQCERMGTECSHVTQYIQQLIPTLLPPSLKVVLSTSARSFSLSKGCTSQPRTPPGNPSWYG